MMTKCKCHHKCNHTDGESAINVNNDSRCAKRSPSFLRDQFIKTNIDIFLIGCFVAYTNGWITTTVSAAHYDESTINYVEETVQNSTASTATNDDDYINPVYAVLYPWFTQTLAILIYYILSRYLQFLPYTAVVFLLGVTLGYLTSGHSSDAVGKSAILWLGINGQVILLVFLPGLIFLDAITINVHLFFQSFWQLIVFAFPMVLVGTFLTALVGKYVFPYGWDWNLSMTFGAILSGTDPIAVAGLLNALGAPPRLKMHISGESLLNDGSAVVFYTIFSQRFFYELGIQKFGSDIGWNDGFGWFFRLCFGGVAIGLAFGLGTVLLLKMLNRRLSGEENVIQVVALISIAYLCYFIAEIMSLCSGIIATITFGLIIKVLGESLINDEVLTLHFFGVTGQLLNTLLFILGGTLWGDIISHNEALGRINYGFSGMDWAYLTALFFLLIVIRFVLVFTFYPITANIGIGTNVKESIFMAYGGFRGSVGIALSLTLYVTLTEELEDHSGQKFREYEKNVQMLFCMVGGISLFTLLISGLTSKPLLQWLGLSTPEKTRQKVISAYKKEMNQQALITYVRLLSQERFKGVEFSLVKEHVPLLQGITYDQLLSAAAWHKSNTPVHLYTIPHLEHVLPYLYHSLPSRDGPMRVENGSSPIKQDQVLTHRRASVVKMKRDNNQLHRSSWDNVFSSVSLSQIDTVDSEAVDEARLNFIEIMRSAYHHQIEKCELNKTSDHLAYSLFQSLEFCENAASKGAPLNDWEATKVASATNVLIVDQAVKWLFLQLKNTWRKKSLSVYLGFDIHQFKMWMLVRQALAFVRAHRRAQNEFREKFASTPPTAAEETILDESNAQVALAEADLEDVVFEDKERIKGHMLCRIILNGAVQYIGTLSEQGLIPEKDATDLLDYLNELLDDITVCRKYIHEGRLNLATQMDRLRQLPTRTIQEFNLYDAIDELSRRSLAEAEAEREAASTTGDDLSSPLLLMG